MDGRIKRPMTIGLSVLVACGIATCVVMPFARALAISALGLFAYYGFCLLLIWDTPVRSSWLRLGRNTKLAALVFALVSTVFIAWYLSRYEYIPVWDMRLYWMSTLQFNERLDAHPVTALLLALESINKTGYNELQCWIMSLPIRFFPAWDTSLVTEFALISVPVAAVEGLIGVSMANVRSSDGEAGAQGKADRLFLGLFLLGLLSPLMLRPVLNGYLDEVGVLVFVCVLALAFDPRLLARPTKAILLGLGLCMTMFVRRWLIYGVTGLVVAAVVWWVSHLALQQEHARVRPVDLVKTFSITLGTVVLLLATVFRGFCKRTVMLDYGDVFSGWNSGKTTVERLVDVVRQLGRGWVVLGVVALVAIIVYAIKKANGESKKAYGIAVAADCCLLLGSLAACLLFWRTQDFSPQHWYVFVPMVLVAFFAMVSQLVWWYDVRLGAANMIPYVFLVCVTCTCGLYLRGPIGNLLAPLTGGSITYPIVQPGVRERRDFVTHLEEQVGEDESVYFACASVLLNHDIVAGCIAPERIHVPFPCESADVDSRDGFNPAFFTCEWVVATNVPQVHMDEQNEQVVVTLNRLVQDDSSCVGRHYARVGEYALWDDTKAYLYHRTSDYDVEDVRELQRLFDGLYPDVPEMFHNRFDSHLRHMQ